MGAETLTEIDRVVNALWFGFWSGVILIAYLYLSHRGADGAPTRWQRFCAWFYRRYFTSSTIAIESPEAPFVDDIGDIAATTTTEAKPIGEPSSPNNEALLLAKAQALAAIIHASKQRPFTNGVIAETRGIEVVFGEKASSTNPRYLAARDLLKAELARLNPIATAQFPPLTEEQQAFREETGLPPRS